MKIAIIGYGNMGQTYASSFVSSGFIKPEDIFVLTRNISSVSNKYSIPDENFYTEISDSFLSVDIVIIAVKPQDFGDLCFQIKDCITENHLILSVMAGISIQNIQQKLQVKKIIRSMPNIPTQIGQGMTVFTASQDVDRKDLFIIQNLINTTGKSLFIENEEMINAATAISGSGPAYVYYFMNAMVNAAIDLGFSKSEAEFLVQQTFLGSTQLQNRSNLSNLEWIEKVASKGGTTEAALHVFQSFDLNDTINQGIQHANNRAKELGKVIDK
ncbi:pyrroline-5-carboxylate reductase [Flavobacterium urocaniciphilum]|uniref:Pyrroline-5-carboxylate reductase n=1 Tax=Flavobacterium urocaniciphilum TaxID=1299341 RepID=A0A1H8Z455_9FLAO|nr:pyrroline-5-carboxylate reductase [Flavobacterium urocaniciphilum]SEP59122.1 pyrroline-5-carboxylate reductase [Flavobacterium urocaniciphilum]